MEINGDEELDMYEEINPKEYQADDMECKDTKETSQLDQTKGLVNR